MVKIVKNNLGNFLVICIIFLMVVGWIFSGWPQIWQEPPVPPKIQETKAAPENLILLWDGADPPSGWSCISCASTDDFYEVFPRGEASYGSATSGASTHTHTANLDSCSDSAGDGYEVKYAERDYPAAIHTHTSATLSPVATSHDPPYRDLKIIQYSGVPSSIPNGVIAIFATTSLPTDWFAYSVQDTYFLRGFSTAGGTEGSNNHTHDVSVTTTAPVEAAETGTIGSNPGESPTHDHDGTGTSDSADHRPLYLEVVFAIASTTGATTTLPTGLIGMFDATPGSNWDVVSDSEDDFYQRFIVGNSTAYGTTGGNATHTHSTVTTLTTSDTISDADTAPTKGGATVGHTHVITATFSSASNLPVYRNVIFAKYTPTANPPSVSSVSLNGGVTPISLNENTTTSVKCTGTIYDANGGDDISSATSTIYRSGEGYTCSPNDNNCYQLATTSCELSVTYDTNYKDATCTAATWFHAEPTDTGSPWSGDIWSCRITAIDSGSLTGFATNTGQTIEMETKAYLIVTSSFSYGTLAPGATSSTSVVITATTTGNCSIDVNLSGTDMTSTSTASTIPVDQQQYATSSIDWADPSLSGATKLTATSTTLVVDMSKPTDYPSTSTDDIYWRIGIPSGQDQAYYIGTTTVTATAD